jgi:hypothetical protein
MPYFRITHNWQITVKKPHWFRLELREGFFRDDIRLYVDDELAATGEIRAFPLIRLKGATLFDVDGRTFELKWEWNFWTGNPKSLVIMHKGRILAQYGNDSAAKIDFDDFED